MKGHKLSKTQQAILDKMRHGWELGCSGGITPRYWIQQGGLGKGGQSMTVNCRTVVALENQGLIQQGKWDFPTIRYELTALGRVLE